MDADGGDVGARTGSDIGHRRFEYTSTDWLDQRQIDQFLQQDKCISAAHEDALSSVHRRDLVISCVDASYTESCTIYK